MKIIKKAIAEINIRTIYGVCKLHIKLIKAVSLTISATFSKHWCMMPTLALADSFFSSFWIESTLTWRPRGSRNLEASCPRFWKNCCCCSVLDAGWDGSWVSIGSAPSYNWQTTNWYGTTCNWVLSCQWYLFCTLAGGWPEVEACPPLLDEGCVPHGPPCLNPHGPPCLNPHGPWAHLAQGLHTGCS